MRAAARKYVDWAENFCVFFIEAPRSTREAGALSPSFVMLRMKGD